MEARIDRGPGRPRRRPSFSVGLLAGTILGASCGLDTDSLTRPADPDDAAVASEAGVPVDVGHTGRCGAIADEMPSGTWDIETVGIGLEGRPPQEWNRCLGVALDQAPSTMRIEADGWFSGLLLTDYTIHLEGCVRPRGSEFRLALSFSDGAHLGELGVLVWDGVARLTLRRLGIIAIDTSTGTCAECGPIAFPVRPGCVVHRDAALSFAYRRRR